MLPHVRVLVVGEVDKDVVDLVAEIFVSLSLVVKYFIKALSEAWYQGRVEDHDVAFGMRLVVAPVVHDSLDEGLLDLLDVGEGSEEEGLVNVEDEVGVGAVDVVLEGFGHSFTVRGEGVGDVVEGVESLDHKQHI